LSSTVIAPRRSVYRVSDIGTTLGALVGGASISKFDRENRSYDVITQVRQQDRTNPELLGKYYVRSASGAMVPLSALVSFETKPAPAAIEQFQTSSIPQRSRASRCRP
jgi:multidrug efflux pump